MSRCVNAALTVTVLALAVVPWTGIAPFSNVAPSAGWSTVRVGARTSGNGTLMNTSSGCSALFVVCGSMAVTLNWLRPRRSSTSADQVPLADAVVWTGCCRPGTVIETVPPGIDVPRNV